MDAAAGFDVQHELKVKSFYRHCVINWIYLLGMG